MVARKEPIVWKVVRRNRWGHRWIEEPAEREAFRRKCRHRDMFGGCAKGCYAMTANNPKHVIDAFVPGCTAGVECCSRLHAWDRRHGLRLPYTIVENKSVKQDK